MTSVTRIAEIEGETDHVSQRSRLLWPVMLVSDGSGRKVVAWIV